VTDDICVTGICCVAGYEALKCMSMLIALIILLNFWYYFLFTIYDVDIVFKAPTNQRKGDKAGGMQRTMEFNLESTATSMASSMLTGMLEYKIHPKPANMKRTNIKLFRVQYIGSIWFLCNICLYYILILYCTTLFLISYISDIINVIYDNLWTQI
jgi:hypothetical protein